MIFLFQIYLLYFTVLLNLFSHSKMLCDFFAASQSESIEFHAIWLCHDQTELLQITSKEARTKNDKLIIYCSISAAFPWNMNPREVLHIQYYIYKWWYFWYLFCWYLLGTLSCILHRRIWYQRQALFLYFCIQICLPFRRYKCWKVCNDVNGERNKI